MSRDATAAMKCKILLHCGHDRIVTMLPGCEGIWLVAVRTMTRSINQISLNVSIAVYWWFNPVHLNKLPFDVQWPGMHCQTASEIWLCQPALSGAI